VLGDLYGFTERVAGSSPSTREFHRRGGRLGLRIGLTRFFEGSCCRKAAWQHSNLQPRCGLARRGNRPGRSRTCNPLRVKPEAALLPS